MTTSADQIAAFQASDGFTSGRFGRSTGLCVRHPAVGPVSTRLWLPIMEDPSRGAGSGLLKTPQNDG